MLKRFVVFLVSFFLLPVAIFAQTIKIGAIDENEEMVVVHYQLAGTARQSSFKVEIYCSKDGGRNWGTKLKAVSGDVNSGVVAGLNKQIEWDVLKDLAALSGNNIMFKIVAHATNEPKDKSQFAVSGKVSINIKPKIKPTINWICPTTDTETAASQFEIKACIESETEVSDVMIFVNYQTIQVKKITAQAQGMDEKSGCKVEVNQKVTLHSGNNTISIKAINAAGETISKTLTITLCTQQKRLALVIGNSNYTYGNQLRNPTNDASAMAAKLQSLGFTVLKYTNANFETMETAFDDFHTKLANYDVGLIFYAGHGVQIDGENYLIPTDAKLQVKTDVKFKCVSVSQMIDRLSEYRKTIIVLLDACRNNPFERNWASNRGEGNVTSGFASMNAPVGTFIGFAAAPAQTASDGEGGNGAYTAAILKYIDTPNETIDDIFTRITSEVMQITDNKQVPWKSSSLPEKFYFVPKE